ncbi:MCE family protein [Flavobacteriaceae bacterium Ap0902]|nr:MCE family protein [Flavobacteriaceae bacterium Ap0902]
MKISKEVKVGIIAIVTMAAFFWLFKFLQGENIFSSGRTFYVKYSNVDGLQPTKPVNVNGLRIGKVDDIIIKETPDSLYFLVKMTIEEDLQFSKNTVAEIYEPGILAGKMIQLNLDYSGEIAKDGDTLQAASSASLMRMVSDKLKPTQNRLDSVLVTLNGALGQFSKLADEETNQSLKSVLKSLDASIIALGETATSLRLTSENASTLFVNADNKLDEVTANTNTMVKTTTKAIDKYGDVAQKLNESKLDETLAQINEASHSLKTTLNRIETADGSLNGLINDKTLYNNLNEMSHNLNILIEDLKHNPDRYVQFSIFGKKHVQKENVILVEEK